MAGLAVHATLLVGVVPAALAFTVAALSFVLGLIGLAWLAARHTSALRERARATSLALRRWSATLLLALALYFLATALWPAPFVRLFPVTPSGR